MKHLLVLIALPFLAGCATCAGGARGVERLDKYAGGFCEATLAVSGDFAFESVGHFNHCFYKSRDFGQCESMSVAPSGSVAIWQDNTGAVVAFRPTYHDPVVLLLGFPTPQALESAVWDESSGFVAIKAWQHTETYRLAIPNGG